MTEEETKQMVMNTKLIYSLMNLTEEMSKDYEDAKAYMIGLSTSLDNLCEILHHSGFPQQLMEILGNISQDVKRYSGNMQNLIDKHIKALSRMEFSGNTKN